MKYFVFVDETGTNAQENLFGLGCMLVPVEHIGEYQELLRSKYDKILYQVKIKEKSLESNLDSTTLIKFYKGRNQPYEAKFKNINRTTLEPYKWLISQYFKLPDIKFCCLIIDKYQNQSLTRMSYFDSYLHQLHMLLRNNLKDDEFVLLPDNISIPKGRNYENELKSLFYRSKSNCLGIHRLESHSSLFLQMVDILTGAVVCGGLLDTNAPKKAITEYILKKISQSDFCQSFTINKPNYFSVWHYRKN